MHNNLTTLSIVIIAADGLQRRCRAILAREGGLRVLGGGVSVAGAPRLLRRSRPNVLLLDAVESPLRALDVLPTLRRLSPGTGVILVGRDGTPSEVVLEGLRRGAWGHLTVGDLPHHLPKAVRLVATREAWIPRNLGAAIVAELHAARQRSRRRPRRHVRLLSGHALTASQGGHR